jgi:hypothetical protein
MKNSSKREQAQYGLRSLRNGRIFRNRLTFVLTLALCFALAGAARAQRRLPGQTGIELSGGFADGVKFKPAEGERFYANLSVSAYNKKGNRWVFGGEYLQRGFAYRETSGPVAQFTAEGGHYLCFLSDPSKTVFLSIGASALAGYETLNFGERELYDGASITGRDGFICGGAVSFEIETCITDRFVLLVRARERVLPGSAAGTFRFQLGAGIKIMIK